MTELKLRDGDQPLPIPNGARDVQSQVIDDIAARRQVGIQRYGTALQPHNGRDALRDAYEEAIDLSMYLKQMILERSDEKPVLPGLEPDQSNATYIRSCIAAMILNHSACVLDVEVRIRERLSDGSEHVIVLAGPVA